MDHHHAATGSRTSTTTTANLLQLLSLSLSLSPASKLIINKGNKTTKRMRLDGAFRCRTCGRSFPTFQALGGHRTSHKRPRVRADGLDLLLGARPAGNKRAPPLHVHRCHTCGTAFPTGQALGGHMRRHREEAAFHVAPVSSETMPTTTSSGGLSSEEGDHHTEDEPLPPIRTLIHFI